MGVRDGNMNDPLRQVYQEVYQDVCRLHAYWKVFCQLFGEDQSVSVLNSAASFAASSIQSALSENIILRITKLTDPAEQHGRKNLSLARLLEVTESEDLRNRICPLLDNITEAAKPLRERRNKWSAHRDLKYALSIEKALPPVTWANLDHVLKLIRAFMHEIEKRYGRGASLYERIELGGDGEALVFYLRSGIRFFELLKCVDRGELTPADLVDKLRPRPSNPVGQ
jgi:hypothetical protein